MKLFGALLKAGCIIYVGIILLMGLMIITTNIMLASAK